jgi:EAL domain-containing protein (putative c-di-GMP-specific phosphodiesterase class I)
LVVEITETVPILDLAAGAAAIRRLRAVGVRVALDDFGAGYNSLTYLHALPVDLIKLDRALTTGIEPERDAALCRSMVRLCTDLGLAVVAEGIETVEQTERISLAGCTMAQGYRFGHPRPLSELALPGAARS